MATNITRAFKLYGWCSRIRGVESGGAVANLPVHTFPTDDGGVDMKCPTEIAITDRREAELAKAGLMPLIHKKNSDFAAFIGAQSLHKPAEYDDPDATANANLGARLPYLFATCRFAHYLKCIVRDKIGSFKERADMQRWLNDWIMNYVDGDPSISSDETKAQQAAGRRRGRGGGRRGQPRLLHLQVLPAAALPARGPDRVAAAGVEAAVGQGGVTCRGHRSGGACDCFLSLDQVPGEAHDSAFAGTIEVVGWNWGVSSRGDQVMGSGPRVGRRRAPLHLRAPGGFGHRRPLVALRHQPADPERAADPAPRRRPGRAALPGDPVQAGAHRGCVGGDVGGEPDSRWRRCRSPSNPSRMDYTPQAAIGGAQSGRHSFNWIAGTAR